MRTLLPIIPVVILAVASGFVATAHAASAVVSDVYSATVMTESRDDATRAAALRDAFARVLVKATGSDRILLSPQSEVLVDRAPELVTLYRFEPVADDAADGADADSDQGPDAAPDAQPGTAAPAEPTRYAFTAQFDPRAVQVTLREAGFSDWSPRRPLTLVWLVTDNGEIVSDEKRDTVAAFVDAAARRGLPLVFPTMDLVDQRAISAADITGLFIDAIRAASRRYDPAMILVGRLRDESSLWAARWTLIEPQGASESWLGQEPSRATVLAQGADRLGDDLLRRYGVGNTGDGINAVVDIAVTGIASLDDYGRVMNFLDDLPPVSGTALVVAEGGRVVVRLHTGADREQIRQSIELGRLLVVDDVADPDIPGLTGPGPLAYTLNR